MIAREDIIEQSIFDYVKTGLVTSGYEESLVIVRDAFPSPEERSTTLRTTTVAIGFNFDDGGSQAELGSELIVYVHNVEFWTFGITPKLGRNVAGVIRHILRQDDGVPLKDYGAVGSPVIDRLQLLDRVVVQRQINAAPRAWDMNVWTTMARFEDYYAG
jgi:hypothetical protein